MKPRMKKVIVLAALMGTCFTAGVFASGGVERVDAFLRSDFHVLVDGKEVTLSKPPLIYDDNSYLPVKEISELLNVNVNWEGATKSIYLNSRVPGQLQAENNAAERYPDIVMVSPQSFIVTYLGAEYPLLCIQTETGNYFRASDLERMGVDIRGVKKTRETYTHALYVREDEIASLWKQKPTMDVAAIPLVPGETDQDKLKLLADIVNNSLPYIKLNDDDDDDENVHNDHYSYIQAFAIDPYPGKENQYLIYSMEEDELFYVYRVSLHYDEKNKKWFISSILKMAITSISQF